MLVAENKLLRDQSRGTLGPGELLWDVTTGTACQFIFASIERAGQNELTLIHLYRKGPDTGQMKSGRRGVERTKCGRRGLVWLLFESRPAKFLDSHCGLVGSFPGVPGSVSAENLHLAK